MENNNQKSPELENDAKKCMKHFQDMKDKIQYEVLGLIDENKDAIVKLIEEGRTDFTKP
jgi:hypothetical protein